MSNIQQVIVSNEKDLGDNFVVRRSLPNIAKKMVGPFIFWDHMGPVELEGKRDMTVRAHPHIGLATITWLFSGEIVHRDSLGNEQSIRPGEVNWMTSGQGIVHSERARSREGAMSLEGIQLWLALPVEHEDVEPSFYHCKQADVPLIESQGIHLRLIAGQALGSKSPVPVYSDLFYLNGDAAEGANFELPLKEEHEAALYVVRGQLEVDGKIFDQYSMICFKKGSSVNFKALADSKVMIFGGEVFHEDRYIWWNFVSSSKEKIEKAKEKWKNKEFPEVINETERIPLPPS